MFSRSISIMTKAALCVPTFLLFSAPILAGDRVHSAPRPAVASTTVFRAVKPTSAVSITLKSADPAKAPVFVSLRGPDGNVRSFPLEGDVVVLSSPVVVRAGKSLTIYWMAKK